MSRKWQSYDVTVDVDLEEVEYHGVPYHVFATANVHIVDQGIGAWECHGLPGVDHHMGVDECYITIDSIECLDYHDPLPHVAWPKSFISILTDVIEANYEKDIMVQVDQYLASRGGDDE